MSPPAAFVQAVAHIVRDAPVLPRADGGFHIATAPNPVGVDAPTATLDGAIATMASGVIAAATAAAAAVSDKGPDGGESSGECRLLGPFALLVQLALGGLALLALVYKRWRERPQRPVKIWFFDASKQVFGSALLHVANVVMSMLTSGRFSVSLEPAAVSSTARLLRRGEEYIPNPCSSYLLNLAIDTTLGIPILILLLRIVTGLVALTPAGRPAESIQSGNYGSPPRAWWWLKQSLIYFCGLFGMKLCVLIIFLMMPWISRIGDWALGWTEGNERLQVAFVMMVFPLIMNALQYYIIDSFIKKQAPKDGGDGEPEVGTTAAYDPLSESGGDEDDDGEDAGSVELEDEEDIKAHRRSQGKADQQVQVQDATREYDPATDGDSQTVIGSTSSGKDKRDARGKLIQKELFPHE